jgi:sarcosine oxidase subunit alpha
VDVLVAGGGVSGLMAALAAGRAGLRVLLMEQGVEWGGRALLDAPEIDGRPAEAWVREVVAELSALPNVRMRLRAQVAGAYDHGYALAVEHLPGPGPRQRLWRLRAGRLIAATGALERPLAFPGNDVPGVMLASGMRDTLLNWAVSPGDRTVVVTNNDDAYRTALLLHREGLVVPAVLDARPQVDGPLARAAREAGIRVEPGRGIAVVKGRRVKAVGVCAAAGEGAILGWIPCEAVAMSGGWSPTVHLWSQAGGGVAWDGATMFVPDAARPPRGEDGRETVTCVGTAAGHLRTEAALASAAAPFGAEGPTARDADEAPAAAAWMLPAAAPAKLRAKMFIDFQNDVKASDVELAAREGFESVEHVKRYTTLGMATDQGKLSNVPGLALLAQALGSTIPEVGTTTFRPPYTPLTMGTIAGAARGDLFQPVRKTPIHPWHADHGAEWEPVGQWRRPFAYPAAGETVEAAVHREVLAVRNAVGLLDASTLGKIVVKGPDAGRFLDMMYTGVMSTLPMGRCRYGLMCTENGFLFDDGVVCRIAEDAWLCHTTTGGAERVHGHMEDWLQTEWHSWRVFTANVTEQWAQVAVAGPRARDLLDRLGGMDLSREALPFMSFAEGTLGNTFQARVHRISFSGELSFEVAVPASQGLALWEALWAAGRDLGVTAYGTEAMHVLRAEKGYVMIGEETDGTVIPQDLAMAWAISKKKPDYLGKRAQEREHMAHPERWTLVGLAAEGGAVLPEGAYVLGEGVNANGQRRTQGAVTSTYRSPTFGRGIAMALLERGAARMGEEVAVSNRAGSPIPARVVDPVLYDKAGERLNG